jgi:hypothetical protein
METENGTKQPFEGKCEQQQDRGDEDHPANDWREDMRSNRRDPHNQATDQDQYTISFVFLQRNRMNTINVLLLSLWICLDIYWQRQKKVKYDSIGGMGAPKKADWREERRKQAWKLKEQGWQQKDIAVALGVSARSGESVDAHEDEKEALKPSKPIRRKE